MSESALPRPVTLRPCLLLLAGLLLWGRAPDAQAFEYPEHVQISRIAIQQVLDGDPSARPFLESIHPLIPSQRLCKTEALLEPERTSAGCFSLADLPALAGDHASTPATLLLRWFATQGAERKNLMALVMQGVSGVGRLTSSPSECLDGLSHPDVQALLKFARDYDLTFVAKQKHTPYPRAKTLDDALLEIDPQYLCLAMRGAAHFRVPNILPQDAAEAHTPNALSWYARFHAQALWFASLGAGADKQETRENWFGLAVLFEMFALHYLEDSVAAGHIVSPAFMNSTGTVRETHNFYNQRGIPVTLPKEVCAALDAPDSAKSPRLKGLCEQEKTRSMWSPIHARVVGDHELASKRPEVRDAQEVTLELSVLATVVSLREVVQASRVALSLGDRGFGDCQAKVSHCMDRETSALRVASCSAVWDESACMSDEKAKPLSLSGWGFSVDRLKAVALMPISSEVTTAKSFLSGMAFMLGSFYDPLGFGRGGMMVGVSYLLPPFAEKQWELGLHVNVYSHGDDGYDISPSLGGHVSLYPYTRVPWSYSLDVTTLTEGAECDAEICLFPKFSIGAEYGRFEDVNVRLQFGGGPIVPLEKGRLSGQLSLDLIVHLRKFPSLPL